MNSLPVSTLSGHPTGVFRLRLIAAACLAVPVAGWAGTPSSGELTPSTPMQTLQYTVGPFVASNPAATGTDGPVCNAAASCDSFKLTVTVPADSAFSRAKITVDWPADSASDYDLYVFSGDRGDLDGTMSPDVGSSASSSNPETSAISLTPGTSTVYTIKVVPFAVVPNEVVTGTIALIADTGGGGGGGGGGDGPSCAVPAGVRP